MQHQSTGASGGLSRPPPRTRLGFEPLGGYQGVGFGQENQSNPRRGHRTPESPCGGVRVTPAGGPPLSTCGCCTPGDDVPRGGDPIRWWGRGRGQWPRPPASPEEQQHPEGEEQLWGAMGGGGTAKHPSDDLRSWGSGPWRWWSPWAGVRVHPGYQTMLGMAGGWMGKGLVCDVGWK